MDSVTNTTEELKNPDKAMAFLGEQAFSTPGAAIVNMEAKGQEELLERDVLPVDLHNNTQEEFEALGFVFHGIVEDDPIFQYATLPEGWGKEAGGNSYWSIIVDTEGVERVSIFYKAAFYDRHAHMYLSREQIERG